MDREKAGIRCAERHVSARNRRLVPRPRSGHHVRCFGDYPEKWTGIHSQCESSQRHAVAAEVGKWFLYALHWLPVSLISQRVSLL